jgi:hypothetical protein
MKEKETLDKKKIQEKLRRSTGKTFRRNRKNCDKLKL